MPFLFKDQVEIQKTTMELPKAALTIVTFFATATAFVMRLSLPISPETQQAIDSFMDFSELTAYLGNNIEFILKVAYLLAMVLTVYFFYNSYNFIARVVVNVTTQVNNPNDDDAVQAQIDQLLGDAYDNLKLWTNIVIFTWAGILTFFVVFL